MLPSPVRAVPFPSESKLSPLYKSAYFVDAFAVTLPARRSTEYKPDALARAFLSEWPAWFSLLMWIRDRVMSIFGVKRSTEIRAAAEKQGIETIAVFPVISHTENEIIVGENDSHLNFQTSILIRENQISTTGDRDGERSGKEMVAITVVHCHGLLGKAYITIIKAFHVLIVKYSLARVPNRVTRKDQ
ncbi:Fc.00g098000.m01.CDS01 [Cosmosporella sp. VM-42]